MPYRFEEYRAAVLRDYEEQKASGKLPLKLAFPTVVNLKEHALSACKERFLRQDENVLISFFERQSDPDAYIDAINKADADIFRPVNYFLKGRTQSPEEKQIELLAWLTDFENRPYSNYISKVEEKKGVRTFINHIGSIPQALWERIPKKYLKLCMYVIIPVLFLTLFLLKNTDGPEHSVPGFVYVCESSTAIRYHLRNNCIGLRNCQHRIIKISLNEAKKTGRTLCHLEGG
ncbi:hypothetical protein FHW88_004922 [Mucilaginibacter sp. SG538B]|uniref:hypothetical protein n=1 Tax=Mucilaginibacter sp. SG538B TaxID=2587021 RepID=UPI001858BAD8|nr:hypothetical protein [Mucilaginibacter sp. SG538B]NVM66604.1 hypothetical protein [Mucilaginibacter sp. SG538B]